MGTDRGAADLRASIVFDDPFGLAASTIRTVVESAGFTPIHRNELVTIDPTEELVDRADSLSTAELDEGVALLVEDGLLAADWTGAYLEQTFAISDSLALRFDVDSLRRVAVKFGWALARAAALAGQSGDSHGAGCEVVFDGTEKTTTVLEHLFIAHELRRLALRPAALTLRFARSWEPAIDFTGDVAAYERALVDHLAIARFCGSYRLGICEAADKFSLLPVLGRIGAGLIHVDLAGVAWLEAQRVIARIDPALFRETLLCAQEHYVLDRGRRHLSTGEEDVRQLPDVNDDALEATFLNDPRGRQLLHVTAGSVLADDALRDRFAATLTAHAALYADLVASCFNRHLELFRAAS